ncbi:hypothetical protein [Histidinibacterium aquaticum]|uniref:Uncharacterized protein n=1 Tax=Histidinibacterium aquaticum TaxID=2613962 RepID=A0A5J5GPF0_9RHOB|nr:hypothetical protein [Histidinibacterium aquaticum]KAA9010040.1 hypothetical protein F3S47_01935 [Histidinibacterium aquaticum]
MFAGRWQIEYLPGTFNVAGMVQPEPPSPTESFTFRVEGGALLSVGLELFGTPEFQFIRPGGDDAVSLVYDEALDLFAPAECPGGTPTLYADGEMVTPDGTLDMDVFLSVNSLERMPGAIVGNVENMLFIRRPIVLTRLDPVLEMPDDLLPMPGDPNFEPGATDDLLPMPGDPDFEPGPADDLLPMPGDADFEPGPADDLLAMPGDPDFEPGATDELLPMPDDPDFEPGPADHLLPVPGD